MSKPIILVPNEIGSNIYLRELGHAYERLGAVVVSGRENFFYFDCRPNIIHIHWPEQLYRLDTLEHETDLGRAKSALDRLRYFKKNGAKCVLTMHNLMPHEKAGSEATRLIFEGCFDAADLVVHHCEKSVDLVKREYPRADGKKTVIYPHGHYLAYPSHMTRQEARESLGLQDGDFVFLHFGIIRGYKGLQRVLNAFYRVKLKNKKLVIAGRAADCSWLTTNIFERVRKKLWEKRRHLLLCLKTIPNNEVQRFLKACDVVVLGHTAGLNSGVAILGMTFGRVVVGPDLGCIGEVLRSGQNVVYDPTSPEGLVRAMEQAAGMDMHTSGDTNSAVAAGWSWDEMAKGILHEVQNS